MPPGKPFIISFAPDLVPVPTVPDRAATVKSRHSESDLIRPRPHSPPPGFEMNYAGFSFFVTVNPDTPWPRARLIV